MAEYKVSIDGVMYGMEDIRSATITQPLFEKFSVGNACAAEFTAEFEQVGDISRMAEVIPFVKANGESAFRQMGVFYIDTRSEGTSYTTITAYNPMLKAEAVWEPDQNLTFPMLMTDAVNIFCELMGVELDSRTELNGAYTIDYPANDYTIRDILRYIAAANGGNWCITEEGKLRLVPISEGGVLHSIGEKVASFEAYAPIGPITGITLLVDDENYYESGDGSGYALEVQCPYGTQEMADTLLDKLKGYTYHGFHADGAELPLDAELGDLVSVCGVDSFLAYRRMKLGVLSLSEISAPGENELEHEYEYVSQSQREIDRKLATTRSLITKTAEEIGLRVEGLESDYTELQVTLDGVTVTDSSGTTLIKGSSIETGTLKVSAANITGQLVVGNLPDGVAMTDDIPSKISDLTNDSGFASLSSVQSYINSQGYTNTTGVVSIINGTVNADYINALGVTAAYLQGNVIGISSGSVTWGAIYPGTNSADTTALTVDGSNGLRLQSSGGSVYISSSGGQFLQLGQGICQLGGGPLVVPGYSVGTSLPTGSYYGQVFFLVSG